MAVFKCKMCGGDLNVSEGVTVAECEYCGTKQTVSCSDDEKRINLYNRANRLRINSEFDKAANIYESIVAEFPEEAEAYWGLVICNYGIEYVDDPVSAKKIPTCHRASFESIQNDENYKLALEYADVNAQKVYRDEAREIDRIREEILAISKAEKPYDIFICYKETDDKGERTIDSVIAQDVYDALTDKGYKVFFSRISLEDKLGRQYEPYIFAALNSAKVMLSFGTKYEYFHAVWVKNEWSRFLKLMAKDKSKVLIPCYKDMDAYDMPEEFKALQAQDMGKVGAIQDLVRGIGKVIDDSKKVTEASKEAVTIGNNNIAPLIERVFMFLEDGDFKRADEFCEQVLNIEPKCAEAYLGKLMVELRVKTKEELKDCASPFGNSNNYQKIMRFADDKLKSFVLQTIEYINNRNEEATREEIYNRALNYAELNNPEGFDMAAELMKQISGYKDADSLVEEYLKKAEDARALEEDLRKDITYQNACTMLDFSNQTIGNLEYALSKFKSLGEWKDSKEKAQLCNEKIEELKVQQEKDRIEQERQEELNRIAIKRRKIKRTVIISILIPILLAAVLVLLLLNKPFINMDVIAAGGSHTVALKGDGTVMATGSNNWNQCDVDDWDDITTVSAGILHTVGLKEDGTVVAAGCNTAGQCNVDDWTDIVAISAGYYHTVGLKEDGTVVATGENTDNSCDVDDWSDITAVSAGANHTVGLKKDGTVVFAGATGGAYDDLSGWEDIIAVSAGNTYTVGLKKDGTVVFCGSYYYSDKFDFSNWTDIVAISAGYSHVVGLKKDGTVVATGETAGGRCDVDGWTDIVAVSAGSYHTVGLKEDGTVVTVGQNESGQCNTGRWKSSFSILVG